MTKNTKLTLIHIQNLKLSISKIVVLQQEIYISIHYFSKNLRFECIKELQNSSFDKGFNDCPQNKSLHNIHLVN